MKDTKRKKKSRREKDPLAALKPELNLKSRTDLLDYDYLDKLNDKEKLWLAKFTEEYVNDHLDRENLKKNLHNTKALKKDCDDRNNARNRCILTRAKASGHAVYLEDLKESSESIKGMYGEEFQDFDNTSEDGNSETE